MARKNKGSEAKKVVKKKTTPTKRHIKRTQAEHKAREKKAERLGIPMNQLPKKKMGNTKGKGKK
ncbi:MAG: hypothetical protein LBL91_05850 [Lachnospiraceae bacterium]|jgi:hypothetical protein|nr:hypothetical protein [Lachnospiraceae bacterium]